MSKDGEDPISHIERIAFLVEQLDKAGSLAEERERVREFVAPELSVKTVKADSEDIVEMPHESVLTVEAVSKPKSEPLPLTRKERERIKAADRKHRHAVDNYRMTSGIKYYEMQDKKDKDCPVKRLRGHAAEITGMIGALEHATARDAIPGLTQEGPVVVHITNQVEDAKGHPPLLADLGIHKEWATAPNPYIMVKEKHLVRMDVALKVAETLPRAADFLSYASSLCAAGRDIGLPKFKFGKDLVVKCVLNDEYKLEPVVDEDGEPVLIPRGGDGSVIVPIDHYLNVDQGLDYSGGAWQVRAYSPEQKLLLKFIVVQVDNDAPELQGCQEVLVNKNAVKGVRKNSYHEIEGKVYSMPAVSLQAWARDHKKDQSSMGFEQFQCFYPNEETRKGVDDLIKRFLWRFEARGGIKRFIDTAKKQDKNLAAAAAVTEAILQTSKKYDVRDLVQHLMEFKDFREIVSMHLGKEAYGLVQGAGVKGPTKTIVHDDSVPEFVINKDDRFGKDLVGKWFPAIAIDHQVSKEIEKVIVTPNTKLSHLRKTLSGRKTSYKSNDKVREMIARLNNGLNIDLLKEDTEIFVEKIVDLYLPGDLVGGVRYPVVHHQNMGFMVCVEAHNGILKKTGRLAKQTVRIHSKVVALHFNGDDDGDRIIIFGNPALLCWMNPRNLIRHVHGDWRCTYGLEADKAEAEKDPIYSILMSGDTWDQALDLVSKDMGGPLGELTYLHAFCMQLVVYAEKGSYTEQTMLQCALAVSVLIQEAVDRKKRGIPYTNPDFAFNPDNWIEEDRGHGWKHYTLPKGHPDRKAGSEWYNSRGDLDPSKVRSWIFGKTAGQFPDLERVLDRSESGTLSLEKGVTMKDLFGWRRETSTGSVDVSRTLQIQSIFQDESLVQYCARRANNMLQRMFRKDPLHRGGNDFRILDALQDGPLSKYDWGLVEIERYNTLFGRSGLGKYNEEMKQIAASSRDLSWGEKAAIRKDATSIMHHSLEKMSVQDVVTLLAQQSRSANHRDKTMNNVQRLISMPGSPIPEALGVKITCRCEYLTQVKETVTEVSKNGRRYQRDVLLVDKVVDWIFSHTEERRRSGEAVRESQVLQEYLGDISSKLSPARFARHLEETGEELTGCVDCREILGAKLRREMRQRKHGRENYQKLLDSNTHVNISLKERYEKDLEDFKSMLVEEVKTPTK